MTTIAQSAIANLKEAGLGDVLHVPGQQTYQAREDSYWSLTPRLGPWAIVQPRTAEEVSQAVKALVKTDGCKFAIRSGGHMSFVDAGNNIAAGVTIDLGLMTQTTYNPETKLASLQPGGRWADVYADLEKNGVLVAGGREGLVGVGGLLTGGGITFYTCRYGLGCDQVVNYEVVLADGSIVSANATSYPDLFRVLKGGHNNFGIVTRFDVNTFECRNIWDGNVLYSKDSTNEIVAALVDITEDLAVNPVSHVLAMWGYLPRSKEHFINMVLTNLDGVENAEPFRKFLDIPGQQNMKTTTVAKKLVEFLLPSNRFDFWLTLTFRVDARIIQRVAAGFEKMIEEIQKSIPDSNFYLSLVLQPLLKSWAQHSVDRGGNILGLECLPGDCIIMVATVETESLETLNGAGAPAIKAMFDDIEAYATSLEKNVDFLYLNYAGGGQNPFQTYGEENIRKMKEASAKYDPTGVFQERVPGGYKISKVN